MGKQWQTFLGSKITADSYCSNEIKRHLLVGRKAMTDLDSILKSRVITLLTKVCLVKAMGFPVLTYGCQSWTIKKAEHWRIDAFELWCWRRLLRVPWTARRSNQSILKEISPGCSLEVQFSSIAQLCPTLCDPMNHSTPGLWVHPHLPEFMQTHAHQLGGAIQPSHPVVPFSSPLQSFLALGSFPMSWLFTSGSQSTGASVSAPVFPMNIQGWYPLGLTGLISLQSMGLSRVFSRLGRRK